MPIQSEIKITVDLRYELFEYNFCFIEKKFNFEIQTAKIGINCDYKKDYQRNWQWCMAILGLYIFLTIGSACAGVNTVQSKIYIVVAGVLENFVTVQISIRYSILLHSLYKRFFALNTFLRLVKVALLMKYQCWRQYYVTCSNFIF